jgi:hypothetical protein
LTTWEFLPFPLPRSSLGSIPTNGTRVTSSSAAGSLEETNGSVVVEHPSNHRPEVEVIDRDDTGMGEDMMVEVEVVEREHEGMVFAMHWTGDGAEMYR